eukprot:scaffold48976_cov80-Phaeocystis_antarctica.AAC.2
MDASQYLISIAPRTVLYEVRHYYKRRGGKALRCSATDPRPVPEREGTVLVMFERGELCD